MVAKMFMFNLCIESLIEKTRSDWVIKLKWLILSSKHKVPFFLLSSFFASFFFFVCCNLLECLIYKWFSFSFFLYYFSFFLFPLLSCCLNSIKARPSWGVLNGYDSVAEWSKACDLKSLLLRRRRFESCHCRFYSLINR